MDKKTCRLVQQGDMSSCPTRRHVFLFNKKGPGVTQKPSRNHPGGTQETPRTHTRSHPGGATWRQKVCLHMCFVRLKRCGRPLLHRRERRDHYGLPRLQTRIRVCGMQKLGGTQYLIQKMQPPEPRQQRLCGEKSSWPKLSFCHCRQPPA